MWRRVLTASLAVGGLAVALVAVSATRSSPSAEDDLRQRLRGGGAAAPTEFTYVGGGTRVIECFSRHRRYGGISDPSNGRAVYWLADEAGPDEIVAFVDADAVALHRSMFVEPPFDTEWVAFAKPLSPDDMTTLREIAGQDLAADLSATAAPPSADTIVEEALDVASSVEPIGSALVDGRQTEGFRIEVSPDELDQLPSASTPAPSAGVVPLLDVWVTSDGDVARIVVRSQRLDRTVGAAEDGWAIDYRPSDIDVATLRPTDMTNSSSLLRSDLRPAALECAVPI